MDYKKKYEDALLAMKQRVESGVIDECYAEEIFPELKESEGERIRKEIISMSNTLGRKDWIAWLEKQGNIQLPTFTFDDILALQCCMETVKKVQEDKELYSQLQSLHSRLHDAYWLEKQGEQKPADKVEPKFKVGDWIVRELDNTCYQIKKCILNVTNNKYGYDLTSGGYISSQNANFYHLWTIQDAKDGDVLYSLDSNRPFIYKERNGYEQAKAYCGLNIYGKFFVSGTKDYVITLDKYVPATKEQRDTLFTKMKEAGYEWDAEKKELKKIEQKPVKVPKFKVGDFIQFNGMGHTRYTIKEVCGLSHYINTCDKRMDMSYTDANFELVEQKSSEWSDEDEKDFNTAIQHIENYINNTPSSQRPEIWADITKLKSLRPQSQWKPSDEQIYTLEKATHIVGSKYKSCLSSLYQELKKLKE